MPSHPPLSVHPAGRGSSGSAAKHCLPAPLGWATSAELPHQRETLSCAFNFLWLTECRQWRWMPEVWPSCTRGGMACPAYEMMAVVCFLDDRIKSLWLQQIQAWHLQWVTSTHANCRNLFSPSCVFLKRQEGRTSLGEKSRDNGDWMLNRGLLGRGFLLHERKRKKAGLWGRRMCAGLFKAVLQLLPQLLTRHLLSPLLQLLQQVPAPEGTFFWHARIFLKNESGEKRTSSF